MLNEYFDKIYYINMDKDVDRRNAIENQFERFGITNYKRIAGVEVKLLPHYNLYRNFIKTDLKYILGSLGCRAAQLTAVFDANYYNYERVLILEDDVTFTIDPELLFENNKREFEEHWDMLYYGGLIEPQYRNQIVCAHAYGLHRNVYQDILNMAEPSGMEIDNFYAKILQQMSYNPTGKYIIKTVHPFNSIVQNKNYESNIATKHTI